MVNLSPSSRRFRLRVLDTDATHVITETPLVIGSHVEVDVRISDRIASRRHAKVTAVEDRVVLEDLKSKNGTWVDERPISKVHLDNGDSFKIGQTTFVVVLIERAAPGIAASFIEDDIQTEREAFVRPPLVDTADTTKADAPAPVAPAPYDDALEIFEKNYVAAALAAARWNKDEAAETAGMLRPAFDSLCDRVKRKKK